MKPEYHIIIAFAAVAVFLSFIIITNLDNPDLGKALLIGGIGGALVGVPLFYSIFKKDPGEKKQ